MEFSPNPHHPLYGFLGAVLMVVVLAGLLVATTTLLFASIPSLRARLGTAPLRPFFATFMVTNVSAALVGLLALVFSIYHWVQKLSDPAAMLAVSLALIVVCFNIPAALFWRRALSPRGIELPSVAPRF